MALSSKAFSRPAGSAAVSKSPARKAEEVSPETQKKAEKLAEEILEKLRDKVTVAALHALEKQQSESSAHLWLERRIVRPAQQVFDRAVQVKRAAVPAPSIAPAPPGLGEKVKVEKKPLSARPKISSVPPPSGITEAGESGGPSALERALSKPDRAQTGTRKVSQPPLGKSIAPAPRASTPPPPPTFGKSSEAGGDKAKEADMAPPPPSTRPAAASPSVASPSVAPPAEAKTDTIIPPTSPTQEDLFGSIEKKLNALRFMETPKEQAEFLIELILQVAPASSALLHVIDARSQEATIVAAHGEQASALSDWNTDPKDALLTQLRRTRRPLRVTTPKTDERCTKGRWALVSPKKYVAVIPVVHERKLVGMIELCDPTGSSRFAQNQVDAVEDVAKHWGALLAQS